MFRWSTNITPWENELQGWDELNEKAKKLFTQILKKDPEFSNHYTFFLNKPDLIEVKKRLAIEPRSTSAFIFLANSVTAFYDAYVTDSVLDIIAEHFQTLTDTYQQMFQEALLNHINRKTNSKRFSQVEKFLQVSADQSTYARLFESGLILQNGYRNLLAYCMKNKINETQIGRHLGVQINKHQELYQALEVDLFLEQFKNLDYSEPSELIRFIVHNSMFLKEYDDDLLVGHEIIKAIIDYSTMTEIHSSWIELILSIASDPRTSKLSPKYLQWWDPIGEKYRKGFIQILSHADILLFLDAFEQFAKKKDPNMSRMFRSRKQFLVGLSIQGLISESRLFLPSTVLRFIKKERPKLDTSYIAKTDGNGNTCIIYLQIGPYHVIEGSHNCKIWLYDRYPFPEKNTHRTVTYMHYRDLTKGLSEKFYASKFRWHYEKSHHINALWKMEVINLLRQDMTIDADQLVLEEESAQYYYLLRKWRHQA